MAAEKVQNNATVLDNVLLDTILDASELEASPSQGSEPPESLALARSPSGLRFLRKRFPGDVQAIPAKFQQSSRQGSDSWLLKGCWKTLMFS
ncbi:hypothetical protein AK812_SmicGene21083 [Symbiodinium microadriaticum]|uniref:Uncharacterized protein n=1 Tax=Symbiodinium microadriaticum TaxID=2951 RepID=A0A1Q9DND0_SYMMI|nr:hypothetical protein AK812_SmicGene21083 [Symbiodinium microadriaticum]